MANSPKKTKKDNCEEEIEKLREVLLKKERKFTEEIEKHGKSRISTKTIISLIVILCGLFYYIKTRDESITQMNEKLNKESKLKDQKINDLNKQFELKDRHLKAVLSESEAKEQKIKELNEKIALKDKRVEEVITESQDQNKRNTESDNKFIKIQTQFKDLESNCLMKDKQIDSLLKEIQLKDEKQIDKKYNHLEQIAKAQNCTPQVLFAPNETTAKDIIKMITEAIHSEYIYVCLDEPKPEFDVYKNCFRDLTIVLHNLLYKKLGNTSYWVVSGGTVDHCFTINIINEKQSETYIIQFGDIYFEIFKYNDVFFKTQTKEDIPPNQTKEEDNPKKEIKEEKSDKKQESKPATKN